MKKYLIVLVLALFFGSGLAIPLLGVYWYNEGPPINYRARDIITPKVPPGGELKIRIEAGKAKQSCHAEVSRSFVDSAGTIFDVVVESRPREEQYSVIIPVPLGMQAGKALYRAKISWSCNPLQEVFPYVVLQPELEFEVVPADGQMQLPDQQGVYQMPMKKSEIAKRTLP